MDRSTKRAAKAFNQLEASLDPVSRAAQNLERQSDKVRIAQEKGIISAEKAALSYQRLNDRFDAYVAKVNRSTSSVATNDNAVNKGAVNYRRFGAAAQQASYQVGDFAVQVASGQNVLVAFTQQASQLLGFFGPWGAVAGAAAAIAGGLALAFWDTADATDDSDKALKDYQRSVEQAESFMKRLNDETREHSVLLREERDELLKNARERVREASRALEDQKKLVEQQRERLFAPGDGFLGGNVVKVDQEGLRDAINELRSRQQELQKLEDRLDSAIAKNEAFKKSQEDDKSRKKAADDAERQAEKIGGVIEALQNEYDLLGQSPRAQAINNALRRAGAEATEEQRASIERLAGSIYDYNELIKDEAEYDRQRLEVQREGVQVTEANRTAQEKYNDEIERLRELLAEGAISQQTYGRAASAAADDLTKANEKLNKTGKEVGRVLGNAFSDLGGWADDARGKVDQLAMSIAEMVWQQQVAQPAADAIGGAIGSIDWGSMFSFADGGVMTSRGKLPLRQYSEGGIANSPQLAMFGEGSVPEAYVPVPSGKIPVDIRMPKMPAANSGGPSAIFNIDARGADQAGMARLETAITAIGGEVRRIDSTFNKRAVNAVSDQARRGGSAGRAIRGR
jgi:hypothetical protein